MNMLDSVPAFNVQCKTAANNQTRGSWTRFSSADDTKGTGVTWGRKDKKENFSASETGLLGSSISRGGLPLEENSSPYTLCSLCHVPLLFFMPKGLHNTPYICPACSYSWALNVSTSWWAAIGRFLSAPQSRGGNRKRPLGLSEFVGVLSPQLWLPFFFRNKRYKRAWESEWEN